MITLRDEEKVDVLIIGVGPIGCTFARYLASEGRKVLMIDAGAQLSPRPGENLKNAFVYQRNIDRFTFVIQGNLNPLSVPTGGVSTPTLDPFAFRARRTIRSGQNPRQDPAKNLPAAAATYAVGGMFTHWTCNTPRHHPTMEQIPFVPAEEWDRLYSEAERVFNVHTGVHPLPPPSGRQEGLGGPLRWPHTGRLPGSGIAGGRRAAQRQRRVRPMDRLGYGSSAAHR
jgi:pyranose oxidase